MARLVVTAAAAVVGFYFGGPAGAVQAASFAYSVTGFLDPNVKVQGPRLQDLKAPSAAYGSPIAWIEGTPRMGGVWAWTSPKHEIASVVSQGKGGPGVDSTTFTYEMDVLIVLTEGPFAGVRRVWSNGKLVWTAADDADQASVAASGATTAWREMRVYTGEPTQLPDPLYEAAFGVGNVPAMRDRGCVVIEGLNLGGSGQAPVLTFECVSAGSNSTVGPYTLLRADFEANDGTDSSWFSQAPVVQPDASFVDGLYRTANTAMDNAQVSWGGSQFNQSGNLAFTMECQIIAAFVPNSAENLIMRYFNASEDLRVSMYTDAGFLQFGDLGGSRFISSDSLLQRGRTHLALVVPAGASPTARLYMQGVLVWSGVVLNNNGISGNFSIGPPTWQGARDYIIDDVRFSRGEIYTGASFVPPASLPPADAPVTLLSPAPPTLEAVVRRQWERGGVDLDFVDASALSAITVRAMAVSQVTAPRTVLETLMARYLFEFIDGRAVLRGGAPAETIPFIDLGAVANGAEPPDPLPLVRTNDTEIPQQITVKFANVDDDYQDGAETSDRLLIGGKGIQVVEVPLGMTPTEAKRLANILVMDYAASMIRVGPVSLTRKHAKIEPTDVVILADEDGSLWRVRWQKRTDSAGVLTYEGILDDATVISSTVVTSGGYNSSTIIRSFVETSVELLDIPILRDVDDEPGVYVAAKGGS